jgi:hypothetical protein
MFEAVRRSYFLSIISCLVLAVAGIYPSAAYAADDLSVTSGDGLGLRFNRTGAVCAVVLDSKPLPVGNGGILLSVLGQTADDAKFFTPILDVHPTATGIALQGHIAEQGLELQAQWSAKPDHLELDGVLRDSRGVDRCVELKLLLPISGTEWTWGNGIQAEEPLIAPVEGERRGAATIYPIATLTNISQNAGLALAIPPTSPTYFVTGASENGLYVILRIGLSPHTMPAGQTSFHLLAYRHDPAWGLRAALEKYYRIYRDPFFSRRVKKIGAWTWQSASALINPQFYAFHEAGTHTWKLAYSGIDARKVAEATYSTANDPNEGPVGSTSEDFSRIEELDEDKKYAIASLPYTIVGQRQIIRLPAMPKNLGDAMQVLDRWSTDQPIILDGPPQSVSYRSAAEHKAIIRSCMLYDAQQQPSIRIRQYRGPSITFVTNPNPRLFSDQQIPTVAKYELNYYLPMLMASKRMDGCYVDSLGEWCTPDNYRHEHFKFSSVPLTYAGNPPQPCLWNLQSHAEYLWELGRQMHAADKIVFGNGVHSDRLLLGFALDAMGMEGLPSYHKLDELYARRVAAGSKPYTVLNAHGKNTPELWNSCLYMGMLVGCNTPEGAQQERRYLPVIIRINESGWEPVTDATAQPNTVGIERWGGTDGRSLYFTVMNRSMLPLTATIKVNVNALHLSGTVHVTELLDGGKLVTEIKNSSLELSIPLDGEQTIALTVDSSK